MKHYLLSISMGLNQLLNAMLGGNVDMSISARAAYAREHGSHVGKCFCAFLELMDVHPFNHSGQDHCTIARYNQENGIK